MSVRATKWQPGTHGRARGPVRAALGLPSFRVLLLVSAGLGCVLCGVPLLGVHGVESALVLGALVPPLAAALGARLAIAARVGEPVSALELAQRAVVAGLLLLAAPVLVLALNALRVRNCAPLEGLLFIALGPGCGVPLAALVGVCIGVSLQRPRLATAAAVIVPVADAGRALYDFYATPVVYAYGHFFGYFPGALYDELVELPQPLLTLRVITAMACVGLVSLLASHYDPEARRLRSKAQPGRSGTRVLCVLALLGVVLGYTRGEDLGHRSSFAYIADKLGGRKISQRCELLVPRELRHDKRERLAADCDFRVRQAERWLGLRQPGRVRVLVFRSAEEKRRLMGAADTNIAKPWRREIYLQDDAWPHPVLPHEMAHIVAGNAGRGPLRVAGKLSGLWPDFALIEGAAVATAWASSSASGMTPHQWTRAMLELKIVPSLPALFGAGFLGQQTRLAYTVSGSLLRYIAETYGAATLRRIYASGDVEGVLGMPLLELERRFHAYLMTVELPAAARALAKQRFEGSSILSSVCPHVKAKWKQELEGYLSSDDRARAAATCGRLLAIDPAETSVRAVLVGVLARDRQSAAAERELQRLQGPPAAAAPVIASARQLLADEAWRNGQFDRAHEIYRQLLAQPNDRDSVRLLQVKAMALEGSVRERDLIFLLLVGEPGQATDGATAVYVARELRAERGDGLAHYLEARQLYSHERYAEAVLLLSQARRLGLPTREIALEARRIEAISRYAANDLPGSRSLWLEIGASGSELALQAEADDWLERIDDARKSTERIEDARKSTERIDDARK
jgi:hypothetical protein